jgi:hypothetical protein
VNFRQIHRCLESGEICTTPRLDEFKNWRFEMNFFCAGEDVHIDVALSKAEDGQYEATIVKYWTE